MARDRRDLDRLATELAALSPDERSRVIASAGRRARLHPPPPGFEPPCLEGGEAWVGGDLTREEIYGDHGR
ncbi:MAG: hypothetical protein HY906_13330 [Deltaproteobacteria bacterium]|nr:hypothetical protein [Deltaproteobacteria bacterium]